MSGLTLACFPSTETLVLADIFRKLVGEKWCGARYWKIALLLPELPNVLSPLQDFVMKVGDIQ